VTLVSKTYWAGMPFWFRKTPGSASVESLVLRAHDLRQLRALYWTSKTHPQPKVGIVVMHPRVDFTQHYAIPAAPEFTARPADVQRGRTCTPRAWLSTWSGLSSNADLVANVARITEPTLVVHAERDREIFPADLVMIEAAIASPDKRVATVAGARHYFEPELGERLAPHVDSAMDLVVPWIRERFA